MTTIDFSTIEPLVNELLLGVLTALASFAAMRISGWLKARRDSELGQIVEKALNMGISFAMSRLTDLEKAHRTVEVKNALVADAANYALVHVPDAVKALGLSGDHLQRMIEARLGVDDAAVETPAA